MGNCGGGHIFVYHKYIILTISKFKYGVKAQETLDILTWIAYDKVYIPGE